ncbi:MAG: MarR family transcriptional regulator [Verrucomicrobiota bacterium]
MLGQQTQTKVPATKVFLVLWRAWDRLKAVDRRSIATTGLNFSDFAVLEALLHKGPLPVNTIGRKVGLTSGSITTAVDRLEAKKLVRRVTSPEDGRVVLVHLTASGRRLIERAFDAHAENLETALDHLNQNERKALVRLLKKLGTLLPE